MKKRIRISVIFNEPTVQTADGRKFISENGKLEEGALDSAKVKDGVYDLSEIGVVEEKESIKAALQALGYQTNVFNMSNSLDQLLEFLRETKPDLIFNLVEGLGDEAIHEMHIAGVYELLGIPYTGSGPLTLGTCLNKARAKKILAYHHLPTPKFFVCTQLSQINADDLELKFPMIVKPSREDASVGIDNNSIIDTMTALKRRVKYIFDNFDQPAIVEEYIDGREMNVAIIGNGKPIVLPISEIDFSGLPSEYPRIVTYDAKWVQGTAEYEGTKGVCPANIPPNIEAEMKDIALQAYNIMGCRDYARVDMRLSKENKPYIIEVNPNPDISDDAGFIRSARTYGYDFDEIVGKIVDFALKRNP